jgi:geranylgeranyl pyrophosphate synthase
MHDLGRVSMTQPDASFSHHDVDGESSANFSDAVRLAIEKQWDQRTGMLDSICRYALLPAGKLFRPVLLLEANAAVGGEFIRSLPAAIGAECGHVASLIHDDIIDGDHMRRGRPSVPYKYGIADSIVAGDALLFQLFASLAECRSTGVPDSCIVTALVAVARAGIDLCLGQSLESELCGDGSTVDSYLTMARLKTGALFRGACECGAILGGGSQQWVNQLAAYGEHLGLAFQIQDDLLPYVSDSHVTGKGGTSDIRNKRWTLPVILAYRSASRRDQDGISAALSGSQDPYDALAFMEEILAKTGALAEAKDMASRFAEVSRNSLADLPDTPSRSRLEHFAELVIARDK